MKRRSKTVRLAYGVLGFALAAAPQPPARAQGYGPYLQVSKSEAGFTVEAEEATLPQVLTALGEKAGFVVHDSAAERLPIPVFEVHDATLESTLRRLLGTSNHLIVYRGGAQGRIDDGTIERIVLLSPGKREPTRNRSVSSLAGPGAAAPTPRPEANESFGDAPGPDDESPLADADLQGNEFEYDEAFHDEEAPPYEETGQLGIDTVVAIDDPGSEPAMPPEVAFDTEGRENGDFSIPPPDVIAPVR